mmetsp:Transcript_12724/g.14589  ORF Transcript_12724/g.14589 Transcript_12724/m.14589 type:complete len:499 (-) Transcript_12724:9-1505(-)
MGPQWIEKSDVIFKLYNKAGFSWGRDDDFNITILKYNKTCEGSNGINYQSPGRALRNNRKLQKKLQKVERLRSRTKTDDSVDMETKIKIEEFLQEAVNRLLVADDCTFTQIPQEQLDGLREDFHSKVINCLQEKAEEFWKKDIDLSDEVGVLTEFIGCGYDDTNPIDFVFKWLWYDFEYSDNDGSIAGFWDMFKYADNIMPTGKLEKAIRKYAKRKKIGEIVEFEKRVRKISYGNPQNEKYGVRVLTKDCHVYKAQRVISTVSSGVYNRNLIKFSPSLKYNDNDNNPMKVKQYLKIFYKFDDKFWEDVANQTHYIYTVPSEDPTGVSMNWMNLDVEGLYSGSNILLLTLTEQEFTEIFGRGYKIKKLNDEILRSLLDPLRNIFGNKFTEPTKIVHNKYHSQKDFGYGAYSSWDKGYTPYDYYHFWGGYDIGDYIESCDHNGCDKNDKWVLYLSGSAMCLDFHETTHGAWHGGEITAKLMLESMGYDIGIGKYGNPCYA